MHNLLSDMTRWELMEYARSLKHDNAALRVENERLRRESSEYLAKWVAAQDLAYNRMVAAALDSGGAR